MVLPAKHLSSSSYKHDYFRAEKVYNQQHGLWFNSPATDLLFGGEAWLRVHLGSIHWIYRMNIQAPIVLSQQTTSVVSTMVSSNLISAETWTTRWSTTNAEELGPTNYTAAFTPYFSATDVAIMAKRPWLQIQYLELHGFPVSGRLIISCIYG